MSHYLRAILHGGIHVLGTPKCTSLLFVNARYLYANSPIQVVQNKQNSQIILVLKFRLFLSKNVSMHFCQVLNMLFWIHVSVLKIICIESIMVFGCMYVAVRWLSLPNVLGLVAGGFCKVCRTWQYRSRAVFLKITKVLVVLKMVAVPFLQF